MYDEALQVAANDKGEITFESYLELMGNSVQESKRGVDVYVFFSKFFIHSNVSGYF